MSKIQQFSIDFRPPITENGGFSVRANALVLENVGDETATINNFWQIKPGGSFQFGDSSGFTGIIVQEFRVSFDGSGANPKLQIAELLVNSPAFSNYIEQ
jgi:hypothetical protein